MSDLSTFSEKDSADKFSLQNPHLLRVRLHEGDILSQKGAMVAYQGNFRFEHHSSGMSRLAKRALSGDSVSLMHARGSGDLFLAVNGLRVHIIELQNEEIYVEPSRLLALDENMNWDLVMTEKASKMYAGGLWHMKVSGSGPVALLSDGEPVLLDCQEGTRVDKNSLIAWSGGLESSFHRDTSFKTWTGRASGESIQLGFKGNGWVLVQPSENHGGAALESGSQGGFFSSLLDLLSPF